MATRTIQKNLFSLMATGLLLAAYALLGTADASAQIQFRGITIATEPNAIIWIDGVRYGKTDKAGKIEVRTVSAGAHTLRIRADGFKDKTQPLTAVQKGEISITLVKTMDEAELAYQEGERLTGEDREKSAEAYRKAVRLRPTYPEAFVGLARVMAEAGEPDEAKKAIAAARRLRPAYPEISAIEGRLQKDNGEEAKAIAAFKRAITEGRGFQPEAYAGLGLLYKEKAEGFGGAGDFENEDINYAESAKYLKTALKQLSGAPDSIVIYQLLGLIYEREKKYAEAIALYEEFLRIFPDTAEATAVRSFIVQLQKAQTTQE
jgi:tetratricopeptide (TPR) repeat protein